MIPARAALDKLWLPQPGIRGINAGNDIAGDHALVKGGPLHGFVATPTKQRQLFSETTFLQNMRRPRNSRALFLW